MTTRTKLLIGISTAFVLGAAGGGYVSFGLGIRFVLDSAVYGDANAIEHYVDTLERMRADEPDAALELLESWLDDTLIFTMAPSNFERGLSPGTVLKAGDAFVAARDYRSAYPRESDRSFVDEAVADLFAAGPPGLRAI